MSFAAYDVERRTRKGSFYAEIDTIIDWNPISAIIDRHYQKGLSASGEKPYDGLLLFKMLLIGMWNNLSDVKVEEHVNDSLSAIKQERFFNEVAEDGVDKEARWLKKGTKTYFGYKKQIAVDSKTVWCGSDAFKRLGQSTHAIYFGSHCLQSEAKSEDGDTSCHLMKKRLKKGKF